MDKTPALTVALSTGYEPKAATLTLRALASQTIADQIEVRFAANPGHDFDAVRPLLERMGSYQIFDATEIDTVDKSSARMAMTARADLVALVEDHAFPDPEWAAALLATFEETGADAVGSAVLNANASQYLSWANFSIAYAGWSPAKPEGQTDWISHHNGAFRRSTLEALGAETVVEGCNRESVLVQTLRDTGANLQFQPKARVRHINPSSLAATFTHRRDVGQLYAALRVADEGWGLPKRVAYAALSPTIPVLRYMRERDRVFRQLPDMREAIHGPAFFIGLVFDAIGQAIGYLVGEGATRGRLARFEMDRAQHLTARERAVFYPKAP